MAGVLTIGPVDLSATRAGEGTAALHQNGKAIGVPHWWARGKGSTAYCTSTSSALPTEAPGGYKFHTVSHVPSSQIQK